VIKKIIHKVRNEGFAVFFRALRFRLLRWYYSPGIVVEGDSPRLLTLGSVSCQKTILDFPDLFNSTIISCGLGEDGSFDVEFASRYSANLIVVDPTPRAMIHFEGIFSRIGMAATDDYASHGVQKFEAYELSSVRKCQFTLVDKALWSESGIVMFFEPVNELHVSHSITNFQRNYDVDSGYPHIEVQSITLVELMNSHSLKEVPLMKLDIEGAEIEVIESMMNEKIYPSQLSVEFDGLNLPCVKAKLDAVNIDKLLRSHGYLCYHHDGVADFLYAKKSEFGVVGGFC